MYRRTLPTPATPCIDEPFLPEAGQERGVYVLRHLQGLWVRPVRGYHAPPGVVPGRPPVAAAVAGAGEAEVIETEERQATG